MKKSRTLQCHRAPLSWLVLVFSSPLSRWYFFFFFPIWIHSILPSVAFPPTSLLWTANQHKLHHTKSEYRVIGILRERLREQTELQFWLFWAQEEFYSFEMLIYLYTTLFNAYKCTWSEKLVIIYHDKKCQGWKRMNKY